MFILFVLYSLSPNVFFALSSWLVRWWCGVSFLALLCIVVLVLCSIFVLVGFHLIFFRTKTRSETKNTSKPNTTNRNNEQEQRTTHQQQEQRTISNTKKETQAQGSKQKIKDTATNQTTFNVVLVFYIACSILRSDFLVRALMVFRVWRS